MQSRKIRDFPQYNGDNDIGSGINILSKKIETGGKKETSDIDIPQDMNEMEYLDEDHMDDDPLEGQDAVDDEKLLQAEERKNNSNKSTQNIMHKGVDSKGSEKANTNDSVSNTNVVVGEKGTVKKSDPVVVIKYECKKCTKICYTESGYYTHLFRAHRIHNVKNYPPQMIEGTMVNSADVHVSQFGVKKEPQFPCDECGQLFFHKSSIQTHKDHTHKARESSPEDMDGEQKKSVLTEDDTKNDDEEKLEKGRQILNRLIRKPGSKKKPKMSQRKPKSLHKTSKGIKNTKL